MDVRTHNRISEAIMWGGILGNAGTVAWGVLKGQSLIFNALCAIFLIVLAMKRWHTMPIKEKESDEDGA